MLNGDYGGMFESCLFYISQSPFAHQLHITQPKKGNAYISGVKVALSFKSAPAQKTPSTSLVIIKALVGPSSPCALALPTSFPSASYSAAISSTCARSSCNNWILIALRASGRQSERTRIEPLECGVGIWKAEMN